MLPLPTLLPIDTFVWQVQASTYGGLFANASRDRAARGLCVSPLAVRELVGGPKWCSRT